MIQGSSENCQQSTVCSCNQTLELNILNALFGVMCLGKHFKLVRKLCILITPDQCSVEISPNLYIPIKLFLLNYLIYQVQHQVVLWSKNCASYKIMLT